ncbi:protein kinase [Micromonospora sp. C31]|uniref:serine/threonine-protein kinase n=1 Tax=Micromonospora sp. C31 TaxID=2824876 RepID=UPI001B37A193|nr:serine/threonine-protein kinase [Micromonospora sp. C31]MBQ1076619.1 protein kinase [Micromonospora sp. C31]
MRLLQQRYRLDEPVGQGGMAVVWRGFDLRLQRTVAVKMLSPELLDDPAARGRLRGEALAAARLDHPHVAGVYDYGEQRRRGRGPAPFLVMEFVDGETLAACLGRSGRMPWHEVARVGAAVADALAAAHADGLVHRDVKPGNVMLGSRGIKVVDFGIAAGVGQDPADEGGLIWGTPAYLAPEQAAGATASPAGDVFALGLVLAECVTGQSPAGLRHDGGGAELSSVPGLPDGVADLLGRCLSPDADHRPEAAEVAVALRCTAGVPVVVRPAGPVSDLPSATGSTRAPTDGPRAPARTGSTRPGTVRAAGPTRLRRLRSRAAVGVPAVLLAAVLAGQLPGLTTLHDAADSDTGGAEAQSGGCAARYTAHRMPDGGFRADLTVTNIGGQWLRDWSLAFALPPGHRLLTTGTSWDQDRRHVTLDPASPLAPGATLAAALRGTVEAERLKAPVVFSVNGLPCDRVVSQIASPVVGSAPPPASAPAAPGSGPAGEAAAPPPSGDEPEPPTAPADSDPLPPGPGPGGGPQPPASPPATGNPQATATPPAPVDPSPTSDPSPSTEPSPTSDPSPSGDPSPSTDPSPSGEPAPSSPPPPPPPGDGPTSGPRPSATPTTVGPSVTGSPTEVDESATGAPPIAV